MLHFPNQVHLKALRKNSCMEFPECPGFSAFGRRNVLHSALNGA